MKKILIIEDEKEIREIERDYLVKSEYEVIEAIDGEQGIEQYKYKNPDLIVLDLNLPKIDGITVCKTIRETDTTTPIIMVTARSAEVDELIGLDIGADDYLSKPFSPRILVARINSLLRRSPGKENTLKIDGLEIDPEKFTVQKNGENLPLTTIQINILLLLMNNAGKVFTREELIDRGYDSNIPPDVFDRTIDSHIKNIRKLIEDNPKSPQYILTVRGKGYKFNEADL